MLRCQERGPKCVLSKCRVSIPGLPRTPTNTTFKWCCHCSQLDFTCMALPFLILNHLPWLKAQLFLKCCVLSKTVFWISHRKTSRIFPSHFFSPCLLFFNFFSPCLLFSLIAGDNTFAVLQLPINSAP